MLKFCPLKKHAANFYFNKPSPLYVDALCRGESWIKKLLTRCVIISIGFAFVTCDALSNVAGGGTGSGPNVTVTDNNDGTVTLANGIASIVIVKKTGRLNSLTYTYTSEGTTKTAETLSGKGQYYYGGFSLGSGTFDYSLGTDPSTNGGSYGDVKLMSTSETNGTMEIHFSMLRGSPGFYSTATMTHRAQDEQAHHDPATKAPADEVGAWGVVTRVPGDFNWLSADAKRNFFIGVPSKKGAKVPDSPHEITVNLDGAQAGTYADKFIYGQDHADLRAWGWSSVGPGGKNIGRWMMTTMEFSDGGPMKRDVSVYPYSELNNSILTGELGMGSDGRFAKGEVWSKTCGPWFIYLNNVSSTVTGASQAAQMLYRDALAQADAEKKAWPYKWFKSADFVPASERGTVTGKFIINDSGNPNASAAGIWVGLEKQPPTYTNAYDFQKWLKPYQFWVQTDANGNFTIPNVIPDQNYTLWGYGGGVAGTFISQNLTGGNPPLELNLPAKPFSVAVKTGETVPLGDVTWTPTRVGATVFELGYPDRKSSEFRHGEDFWNPGTPAKLGYPTPVWGGQMEFPLDFPDGMNYTVGKSQWTKDWNYVLPARADATGAYLPCTGTITFNLAQAPANGAKASLYIACAGDDGGHTIVSVNGANLGDAQGVVAAPNAITAAGFDPPPQYSDDSSIHFGDHGPFSDERINFPATMLHAGTNTVALQMNAKSMTCYLMVDYLRLELSGYVPPAPLGVGTFAGSNKALVCWPLVPGATSYNILRAKSPGTDYVTIAAGNVAPVCGSGPSIATFTDTSAANGSEYHYVVQSVNSNGHSINSPASAGASPSSGNPTAAPLAPEAVKITNSGHHLVALSWNASPAANYYSVWRTTLHKDGVGGDYPIGTILLSDAVTGSSYTDSSPTDGRIYSYYLTANNASGSSSPSAAVTAVPLPDAPTAAPASLSGHWAKTRNGNVITISWSPVPGAAGYVIYRSTGSDISFKWPENFLTALVETTYTDKGNTDKNAKVKGLNEDADYSYQVTAVNAGGISPPATVHVPKH